LRREVERIAEVGVGRQSAAQKILTNEPPSTTSTAPVM
jgi:hypothetical protein